MTLRPTIEDSLTLPHIHSMTLISGFLPHHVHSSALLSSSGGHSLAEILKFEILLLSSSELTRIVLLSLKPTDLLYLLATLPGRLESCTPRRFSPDLQRGQLEGHL